MRLSLDPTRTARMPKKQPTDPAPFDQALGEEAFLQLKAELDAVPKDEIRVARVDVHLAFTGVQKVLGLMGQLELELKLAAVPPEMLPRGSFQRLDRLSWTTMYADRKAKLERAVGHGRALPDGLEEDASKLEKRMQFLCEQMLMDEPGLAPTLLHYREGSGHRDLAYDLEGYADLYEAHADIVKLNLKYYDAADVKRARHFARAIYAALSANESAVWVDYRNRAFTLLVDAYEDVVGLGRYLVRRDAALVAQLPTLHAISRRSPRSRASEVADPVDPPVGEIGPAGG